MLAINRLSYVRRLCALGLLARGEKPTEALLDSMARTVCDVTYNPRHLPSLLGEVAVTPTYVCIGHADRELDRVARFWWNKRLYRNGHPTY